MVRMSKQFAAPSLADQWPLVGRSGEVADICARLQSGRGVLLAGSAGVGKSRLAAEVLQVLTGQGIRTARVSATSSSSSIPLGVFAPLVPASAWIQKNGGVTHRADLLSRFADMLVDQHGSGQLVLMVDDIHLLDEMSATLVYQMADTNRAVLLATYRTREATSEHVVNLWKNGVVDRVEVEGLSSADIEEVVKAALQGPVDDGTLEILADKVRGNVLFLRELIIGAIDTGSLVDDSGVWRLHGGLETSDRLVELVTARLGVLTTEEHRLVSFLAFGEPLTVDEVERLGMLAAAGEIERKGLLLTETGVTGHLQLRIAHPLYSEVVRSSLPPLRVREVVRELAESVELDEPLSDQRLMRVAEWRLLAGGGDPDQMLTAAYVARWHYDFVLSDRMAAAVLHQVDSFDAGLLRAELASLRGNAEESSRQLSALADSASTPVEIFRVAVAQLDHRAIYAGTVDEGLEVADEAERSLAGTPYIRDIAARRAALILGRDGPAHALAVAEPLLKVASGSALVWACMPAAYSLARTGRIAEALEVAELGRSVQTQLQTPMDWYPFMHRFYEAEAYSHAGEFTKASMISRTEYEWAVQNQAIEAQALFCWQRAKAVVDCGYPVRAVRLLSTAVSIYRQLDRPQFVQFCLGYLALAQAVAGKPSEGRKTLQQSAELGLPSTMFMGVDPINASGWVHALSGDLRSAHVDFELAACSGREIGDRVGAIAAAHALARTGAAARARELCVPLARGVEGDLVAAKLEHILALDAADSGRLERVAERFERLGAILIAAEAYSNAAAIADKRGDAKHSAVLFRRVGHLVGRCENPLTSALDKRDWHLGLTAAEMKTATLAASGMSNKGIAAELSISVRTVENRLQGVYAKLCVNGRHELPEAISGSIGAR